jgi:hypothetical protein
MGRTCYFHAGCPDGFGAAWAVWHAWQGDGRFVARGHDDASDARLHANELVVFVDIAPDNDELEALAAANASIVVLDHHTSARERFLSRPGLADELAAQGHQVNFDLDHSGAILAWYHFHPGAPPPELLRYVEDQDLWRWKLPDSEEVNAAIDSYAREMATWDDLAARPVEDLAAEGSHILRAHRMEVERALQGAHPIRLGSERIEAVNSRHLRASIGHELAKRASFGRAWGLVYRIGATRVDASIYSIGELDVSRLAERFGGGGHRNAAGFTVPLRVWLDEFLRS